MPALEFLDGAAVRRWCAAAAEAIGAAREQINALNVFPVADRDTGTNLHHTMLAACRALDELPDSAGSEQVWQALAHGVLLGALGNSGVIVSQFLRGLAEICAPAKSCDGAVVREGLAHAARLSQAAVGQPVEGTVLTVASASADAAAAAGDGLAAVTAAAAEGGHQALVRTTAQLDVLAHAGVVDAGAAGLCLLLDALAAVVTGTAPESFTAPSPAAGDRPLPSGHRGGDAPGYEVMYLLEAADEQVARLRDQLERLGESLVVVGGAGLWNVHVHVADAGAAIEAGLAAGRPRRIRVNYLGAVHGPGDGGEQCAAPGRVSAAAGHGAAAGDRTAAATRWGQVTWKPGGGAARKPGGRAVGRIGDEAVMSGTDPVAVAADVAERLLAAGVGTDGDAGRAGPVTLVAGSAAGEGVPDARAVAAAVAAQIEAGRPEVEIVSYESGDPGYVLLIGVE